mmetsp:Transcript_57063/g.184780  ORF Transcript_57063/g.184780 Transcript_57063/m.184780 type:complete len:277 (+) Transcript_57063:1161-1991(+)
MASMTSSMFPWSVFLASASSFSRSSRTALRSKSLVRSRAMPTAVCKRMNSSNLTPLALSPTMTLKIISKVASLTVKPPCSALPRATISLRSSMLSLFLSYLVKMALWILTTSLAAALAKNLTRAALSLLLLSSMPFLAVLACLCRVKKFGVSSSSSIFLNVPTTLIGPPLVAIKLMAAFALSEAISLSASTFATALLTADSLFKSVFSHKVLTLTPNFVAAVSAVSTSAASSTRSSFVFCLAASLFSSASFIFSSFFLRIPNTNLTLSCPTSMAFS